MLLYTRVQLNLHTTQDSARKFDIMWFWHMLGRVVHEHQAFFKTRILSTLAFSREELVTSDHYSWAAYFKHINYQTFAGNPENVVLSSILNTCIYTSRYNIFRSDMQGAHNVKFSPHLKKIVCISDGTTSRKSRKA